VECVRLQGLLEAAQPPLSDYARPEHFVLVPKIARTTSCAVDESWLEANAPAASVYVAPRNDAETRVQRVFADILSLPEGELKH
jgi:hypothetical protein